MKTFLDFGTNCFEGLDYFTEILDINSQWAVQCYEADPFIFSKTFGSRNFDKFKSFSHQNLAIFDACENITINCVKSVRLKGHTGYQDGIYLGDFGGSSLIDRSKETGANTINETVKAIVRGVDVNSIIHDIVKHDAKAQIYIKCDIEGSEYSVLTRILSSPHLKNLQCIYVEWHSRFFAEDAAKMQALEDHLKAMFALHGVSIREWH